MEEAIGVFGAVGVLVFFGGLLVIAILAFLLPVFVVQIRNQVMAINKNLGVLVELISFQASSAPDGQALKGK